MQFYRHSLVYFCMFKYTNVFFFKYLRLFLRSLLSSCLLSFFFLQQTQSSEPVGLEYDHWPGTDIGYIWTRGTSWWILSSSIFVSCNLCNAFDENEVVFPFQMLSLKQQHNFRSRNDNNFRYSAKWKCLRSPVIKTSIPSTGQLSFTILSYVLNCVLWNWPWN